jgi:hypothetical protein
MPCYGIRHAVILQGGEQMRIGINIRNELMRRLEPLKPALNISQVCREALAAKAESYERMVAGLDDDGIRSAVGKVLGTGKGVPGCGQS